MALKTVNSNGHVPTGIKCRIRILAIPPPRMRVTSTVTEDFVVKDNILTANGDIQIIKAL